MIIFELIRLTTAAAIVAAVLVLLSLLLTWVHQRYG